MSEFTRRNFVKGAVLAPLALKPLSEAQASTAQATAKPRDHYDIVIAGAGHNSLITGCYLAKAGYSVIVLDGSAMIGGDIKTSELVRAGFHDDVFACEHEVMVKNPLMVNDELHLKDYGLEYIFPDPIYHVPFVDGTSITQWQDFDRTCEEIAKFSKKDAATYRRITDEVEPIRKHMENNFFTPLGMSTPISEFLAKRPDGGMWQRRMLQSEYENLKLLFENDRVRTFMITPWPENLLGPTTGMLAYYRANRYNSTALPKGGSGMLCVALGRYLEAHGGVILCNKPVTELIVEGGKCTGVECADGSKYRADKAVISTIHVKLLVDMAPKKLWPEEFLEGVETFHIGPAGFNTHYALKSPLLYPKDGGTINPVHSTTLSSTERGLYLDVQLAVGDVDLEDPVLHITQVTSADPTRAPAGMHVLRILARSVYHLKVGGPDHWEEIKEQVADAHLRAVQRRAHNFTNDMILGRSIFTPVDFYRSNPSNYEGCGHGGTDGASQAGALRPAPGWSNYKMPIPGLYQTGGTTHPGFGVNGASGRNAAWVMLKEFGTSLEEVVSKKEPPKKL